MLVLRLVRVVMSSPNDAAMNGITPTSLVLIPLPGPPPTTVVNEEERRSWIYGRISFDADGGGVNDSHEAVSDVRVWVIGPSRDACLPS